MNYDIIYYMGVLKEGSHSFFYLMILLIGLFVGSFLNVLVYRLPIMMHNEWLQDAKDYLSYRGASFSKIPKPSHHHNTLWGRSYCPHCHAAIPGWLNIPVLTWLLLRGKTKCCNKHYSPQYPLIELLGGLVAVTPFLVLDMLPATVTALAGLLLLAIAMIDHKELLIPDVLSHTLLWGGLLINTQSVFVSPGDAIMAAAAGYALLEYAPRLYGFITGRPDMRMGGGDAKITAAIGAWLGMEMMLASLLIGIIITICLKLIFNRHFVRSHPLVGSHLVPFGPGLAISLYLCLLFNQSIFYCLFK